MNRKFRDARYYLGRAATSIVEGIEQELSPVARRVRRFLGREEPEPEPDGLETVQRRLSALETRAEGEAKRAVRDARERVRAYRRDA